MRSPRNHRMEGACWGARTDIMQYPPFVPIKPPLSSLYKLWVKAALSVTFSSLNSSFFYESRHIILSTLSSIRLCILTDAKRVSHGVRSLRRDGTISESNRFSRFFEESWVSIGWASFSDVNINSTFPIRLDLRHLRQMFFHDSSHYSSHGFSL